MPKSHSSPCQKPPTAPCFQKCEMLFSLRRVCLHSRLCPFFLAVSLCVACCVYWEHCRINSQYLCFFFGLTDLQPIIPLFTFADRWETWIAIIGMFLYTTLYNLLNHHTERAFMLCREGPSLWHKQRGSTDHHLLFKYTSPKHSRYRVEVFHFRPWTL